MGWVARGAAVTAFVAGVILFTPLSCWEAECPPEARDCRSSGCDNLIGMTFDSMALWVGILAGLALAATVLVLVAAIRATGRSRPAHG